MKKTLYIISGCNGAGKTTASVTILPEMLHCREFINADEIAKGLSPFNPEGVAIEAGRLMLKRIDELVEGNESFSIETTLSTRSYSQLVDKAHQKGFIVKLLFFWLKSPEAAIKRVAYRVSHGGHNIPNDVIRRRYTLGIENLFNIYMSKVDHWSIYCNSMSPRIKMAEGGLNKGREIYNVELFNQLEAYVRK